MMAPGVSISRFWFEAADLRQWPAASGTPLNEAFRAPGAERLDVSR